jgi:hypothetical protein
MQLITAGYIPQPRGVVLAGGQDVPAVRRKDCRANVLSVAGEFPDQLTVF